MERKRASNASDNDEEDLPSKSGQTNSSGNSSGSLSEDDGDKKMPALPTGQKAAADNSDCVTTGDDNNMNSAGAAAEGEGQQDERAKKRMRTSASSPNISQDKISHEQRWVEMFNRLVAYKNKNGMYASLRVYLFLRLSRT